MEVVIVRHGHRLNWVQEDWGVEWQKNRPNDSPLSDVGLQQARELAQYLTQRPVSVIYASPYFRTLQTANEIALLSGVPIHVENGISEWTNSLKYRKEETITPKVWLFLWLPLSSSDRWALDCVWCLVFGV